MIHQFLLRGTAASSIINRGSAGGSGSWINFAGAASSPLSIESNRAQLGPANSLDTGFAPTGDLTILLLCKLTKDPTLQPTNNSALWLVAGNTQLRVDQPSGVLVDGFASTTNQHLIEPGWGIVGFTLAGTQGRYFASARVSRVMQTDVRTFPTFVGNTDTVRVGGFGSQPWYQPWWASEIRIYASALTPDQVFAEGEEMQASGRSLGLNIL